MTTFLLLCAVMIVAALAIMLVPLLRNVPAEGKDAKVAPRAVPAAVALMVALPLAASAFYGSTSNFPWDNPGAVTAQGAGHAQDGGSMEEVAMGRPSWLLVPGFALRIMFGQMAEELMLSGQRALPKRLLEAGSAFSYPEAGVALRDIVA